MITSSDLCDARRTIELFAKLPIYRGSPRRYEEVARAATLIVWQLQKISTKVDLQINSLLQTHISEIISHLNQVVDQGWITSDLSSQFELAHRNLLSLDPTLELLDIPTQDPFDPVSDGLRRSQEAFDERRHQLGTALIFWVFSVSVAAFAPIFSFFLLRGGPHWAGFWSYWERASHSMDAWRAQELPLVALVVALLAMPVMSNTVSPWDSRERRAQQLLLQPLGMWLLVALSTLSLASIPVQRTVEIGGHSLWSVADILMCLGISIFSCLLIGLVHVAADERLKILGRAQKQIQLVQGEVIAFTPLPPIKLKKWGKYFLSSDRKVLIFAVGSVLICLPFQWPASSLPKCLLLISAQFTLAMLALEYSIHVHLLEVWGVSVSVERKRWWSRSFDVMALMVSIMVSMCIAIPAAVHHGITNFIAAWSGCLSFIVAGTLLYARLHFRKESALRLRYFEATLSACKKTIEAQEKYLTDI